MSQKENTMKHYKRKNENGETQIISTEGRHYCIASNRNPVAQHFDDATGFESRDLKEWTEITAIEASWILGRPVEEYPSGQLEDGNMFLIP